MPSLLVQSLQNISVSFIVQIILRIVILASNGLILRKSCAEALALISVRLQLLESIVFLLSTESIRKACQGNVRNHDWPRVVNLLWMTVPLCTIVTISLGLIWQFLLKTPPRNLQEQYAFGVWAMCVSCIIETFAEVPNFLAKAYFFSRLRLVMNLSYMLVRNGVFVCLVLNDPSRTIKAFSAAQFLAALTWVAGYYTFFSVYLSVPRNDFPLQSVKDFLPTFPVWDLPWTLVSLTSSLYWTLIAKNILQEGERYMMTITGMFSLSKQALYSMIQDLGIFPVRLLLKPLDEPLYFYFSQIFVRGGHATDSTENDRREGTKVIYYALQSSIFIGSLLILFGAFYSKEILKLYGGKTLNNIEGSHLLQAHFILFMPVALLVITESFSLATMSHLNIKKYNLLMGVLPAVYLFCSWSLTYIFNGVGLVLANCCVTIIRVAANCYIMHEYFQGVEIHPMSGLILSYKSVCNLVVFLLICIMSQTQMPESHWTMHLTLGFVSFLLAILFYTQHMDFSCFVTPNCIHPHQN